MYNNFDESARRVLVGAKKEMYELKHPYIGSEHLMLSILKDSNPVSLKLKQYNLTYDKFKEEIVSVIGIGSKESDYFLYTPLLKRVIENSMSISKENKSSITVENLFNSLLEEGEGIAIRIMLGMNINVDELYSEFTYNPLKSGTRKTIVEELGVNLNDKALNNEIDPVIGRDKEIKRLLEVLSRRCKNNPLLIGDAGVGKTAIVEELSRLIVNNEVPISLQNKKIICLDMASTVAGTKYRGEFEERMRKILKEIEENDEIILFIDEIHTLVGAGGAEGAIDASNIFKPALARNKIRCIGATTIEEYKKYIEKDSALDRRFQKIYVEKPNKDVVKDILMNLKNIYEEYHKVIIDEDIIDLIISLSSKYIYDRNEPDKSIDILDEVCAKVNLKESKELCLYKSLNKELKETIRNKNKEIENNNFVNASSHKDKENELMTRINELEISLYKSKRKVVTKEDVYEIITSKTKIPIYEFKRNNVKLFKKIKSELNNKIYGQEEVVDKLVNNLKINKLGLKENKVSSMLFVGGSGVGKTRLAKLYGDYLVGSDNIIKLDMSEYIEPHSVSKLIGTSAGYIGYDEVKNVFEEIRNKPYSVLILDEIEKANQSVINLFFKILDEGYIKDSKGNYINFNNVTIIMTSNIGFLDINVGFNKSKNKVIERLKESLSVPFINRIDDIVVFNKLTKENIKSIINYNLNSLKEKYKDISIKVDNSIIDSIIEESNFSEFGARKLEKIIKTKIENNIIENIINNEKKLLIT